MQIFLSYSNKDRFLAEDVQLALLGAGHSVFFDQANLPAGGDFYSQIEQAVKQSDIFIFLISSNSLTQGAYALTELMLARKKWPHPKEHVLPVLLHDIDLISVPPYLKSVTILKPEGNVAAEVVVAVSNMRCSEVESPVDNNLKIKSKPTVPVGEEVKYKVQIWVAIIGLISAIGVALIANWHSIFEHKIVDDSGSNASSPADDSLKKCTQVTETDYSKNPAESKIVNQCQP